MDYELAKQLKDAGWPQNRFNDKYVWPDTYDKEAISSEIRCVVPTLEDLIEALGGKNLKLSSDFKGNWAAYLSITATEAHGKTAINAAAQLWLAHRTV